MKRTYILSPEFSSESAGHDEWQCFGGTIPGGKNKNGVAAVEIKSGDGSIVDYEADAVRDAEAALEWFDARPGGVCLGIDSLLSWSHSGGRKCDDCLRSFYKGRGGESVIPQNSLRSAMTLNGVLVAMGVKVPLCESHPKLMIKAGLLPQQLIGLHSSLPDDAGDALVAGWCASQWHFKKWKFDLFSVEGDNLTWPAGTATYPWPEAICAGFTNELSGSIP